MGSRAGGRGGGTLKFSYKRRLGLFFWVQKFEFQYFWGFQKKRIFLGYEDFVDIFFGSPQNWPIFRSHFYAFYGLFLMARYRMGDIFGVAKISNIFWGYLEFLIFLVNSRCWA